METTIRCPHCEQQVAADEQACPACGHIHGEKIACQRHDDRTAEAICVVCGDAVCDECDEGARPHHACPDHRAVPLMDGWAQIYTTSDSIEAGLIRENLQSEGLDAAVLDQKDSSFSVELGDLSPVRVLVPAYNYLEAISVLASRMDARGEVAFACPACGEAYDTEQTACDQCGRPLPTARGQGDGRGVVATE
jgi:hypothetical protein